MPHADIYFTGFLKVAKRILTCMCEIYKQNTNDTTITFNTNTNDFYEPS